MKEELRRVNSAMTDICFARNFQSGRFEISGEEITVHLHLIETSLKSVRLTKSKDELHEEIEGFSEMSVNDIKLYLIGEIMKEEVVRTELEIIPPGAEAKPIHNLETLINDRFMFSEMIIDHCGDSRRMSLGENLFNALLREFKTVNL